MFVWLVLPFLLALLLPILKLESSRLVFLAVVRYYLVWNVVLTYDVFHIIFLTW